MPVPSDISLTFAKGLEVLKCFDGDTLQLTIPEIGRRTGLDRAVVRRLVLTLVDLGYVAQLDRSFTLTPRILVLAGGFLQGRRFGKLIQPLLSAYATQAGLPLSLALQDGADAVYVAHAGELDQPRIGFTVGSRVPMSGTAIGSALREAQRRGHLFEADGAFEPGIVGIATGFACDCGFVAAVGTSGPSALLRDPLRRAHVDTALVACAAALAQVL